MELAGYPETFDRGVAVIGKAVGEDTYHGIKII